MRQTSPRRLSILLAAALMAALALPCFAAAPSAPPPAALAAGFIASLAAPVAPAPIFLQTIDPAPCTKDSQCPPGKLCCRGCATPDCTRMVCQIASDGHCPYIP